MAKRGSEGGSMRHLLAEMLTPATLRKIIGLDDSGETAKVKIGNPDGSTPSSVDSDGKWVRVWVKRVLDGFPILARLYSPGNMLWWLPSEGDVAVALRPLKLGGPLTQVVLHGLSGAANLVPSWLSSTKAGISPPAGVALRVESKDQNVEVDAPGSGKKVLLGGGGAGVARNGDGVDCGALKVTAVSNGAITIEYTPPGGSPTPYTLNTPIPLQGKINQASSKVESG